MYSQRDEEKYILEAFDGKTDGRFLDIGAWHPTVFSNTRALIEMGWSGVMIEPSPGPFLNIVRACIGCGKIPPETHGERKASQCPSCGCGTFYGTDPRLTLIPAAVGMEGGLLRMRITDDAVSTSKEANYQEWKEIGGFYGEILVPVLTWRNIYNQFEGFDFVSIDAEGISADLFMQLLQTMETRPPVICVEHDGRHVEVGNLATSKGYKILYVGGENLVMAQ